jgi:hypothetical protein
LQLLQAWLASLALFFRTTAQPSWAKRHGAPSLRATDGPGSDIWRFTLGVLIADALADDRCFFALEDDAVFVFSRSTGFGSEHVVPFQPTTIRVFVLVRPQPRL